MLSKNLENIFALPKKKKKKETDVNPSKNSPGTNLILNFKSGVSSLENVANIDVISNWNNHIRTKFSDDSFILTADHSKDSLWATILVRNDIFCFVFSDYISSLQTIELILCKSTWEYAPLPHEYLQFFLYLADNRLGKRSELSSTEVKTKAQRAHAGLS